jgi:glycosyltransferase involved in cell wall biosynthesis
MKIFQLIQKPQLRGAEIFASQLSANLQRMGDSVELISLFPGEFELPFEGHKITLDRPLNKRFFDLKGWRLLAELIKKNNPDIIQANAADTLKYAVFSKLIYRWKTPIIYRNANKMGDFIKSQFQFLLNSFLVNQTDFVISVSYECENDFKKTFGYPSSKIETVQIGVEPKNVGEFPMDLSAIKNSYPILVNVAGFVPEKNHKGLIYIFRDIVKNYPEAQLLLIGTGRLEGEIKTIVKTLGLSDNVKLLGSRTDVLEIVKASHVFLMPSLIEGLPAVILEAMYCRTPVIAYNVGGIGEVVKNGKTGWLIDKDKEEDFVSAIKSILTDQDNVHDIVDRAAQMVSEEFMNKQITKRFQAIYKTFAE